MRTVHVEVTPSFENPEKSGYHVSVELNEEERQLKGAAFIEVVRKAMARTLDGGKIMVHKNGLSQSTSTTQMHGRFVGPDEISIQDKWRYKDVETRAFRLT